MAMGNNPGQVDHVVMMVWPENLEAAVERLATMLEVEWEFFDMPAQGIVGAISLSSGLEFIAPRRDGSGASESLERLLEQRGEGIHSITFGVADAHATHKRLAQQGFKTREVFDAIPDDAPSFMKENYDTTLEIHMRERIFGTLFVLSQIEKKGSREPAG